MPNNNLEGWREEFDKKFNLHDERCTCYFKDGNLHEDASCPHVRVKSFIRSLFSSLQQKIEEKYGKYGSHSGSLGYQGMISGIQSFQNEKDTTRDGILDLFKESSK